MAVINYEQIKNILFKNEKLNIEQENLSKVEDCYNFLKDFAKEKVIYGINTGFGPMAQWRVDDLYLNDLQYNIIRSHSTGAGEPLPDIYVKAAMIVLY